MAGVESVEMGSGFRKKERKRLQTWSLEKDWIKVERTQDLIEYVYDKYVNTTVTDEMLDDLYNFAMMKEKYLSMVESEKEKAKLMVESEKEKAKLMVSDEMIKYALAKYGKNWNIEDEIVDVIPKDLRIKMGKVNDNGKGKVDDLQYRVERLEGNLARAIKAENDKGKAKQAKHDLDDVDLVDALDLENRIKKLEEDFSRLLKAKEAEEAKLKVNKEVVQVSSDEGFSGDEDDVCFNDVKYPLTDAEIRMFKEKPTTSRAPTRQLASTFTRSRALVASTSTFKASTRSRAPIAFTSNAQAASTSAPRVYRKIVMTRCVLSLILLNAPNAPPPSAPRKRKSKP
ncbi:hypothetical protein Tco_1531751 [Tanacetum coccineum]